VYAPGSELALREASESLAEFKLWGFLSRECPVVDSTVRKTAGALPLASRQQILKRLLRQNPRVTTGEYLNALSHRVSRQQAIADLHAFPDLTLAGAGRGSRWMLNI
jgi:hypothetical protein